MIPTNNVYWLPRVILQFLQWEIYMIPKQIGYKHIHGAIEYRMRLYFYLFLWNAMHDLKHSENEYNHIYLTNYNHDKAYDSTSHCADVGNGYNYIRTMNNIHLNMNAKPSMS